MTPIRMIFYKVNILDKLYFVIVLIIDMGLIGGLTGALVMF